ncbi:MAG TPA: hypothetical protein VHV51_15560 [Polyangiaceae bacterium]|jgi:hypothetical protein|nr:hypothetical protein [Polyangiaceae bacterium]
MQRKKRLTKRERKDQSPGTVHQPAHIHCIACGRHLDADEFSASPPTAKYLICEHQSRFPACVDCEVVARSLLAEHDRTGRPIQQAQAWH